MMAVLLGVGVGLLVAGLAALGYGILIKDFSFGNALIVSGAVAACSGLIMFGLWVVARALQDIARRLGAGIGIAPQRGSALDPALALPRSEPGGLPYQTASEKTPAAEQAPPWPMEAAAPAVPPPPPAEASPEQKQKRNLLFSSSSRKERERATARTSEPLAPDLLSPDLRPPPSAVPPPAPAPEPDKPPPPTFEDAWPKPERPRPGDALRRGRTPQPAPESSVPPPAPREPAPQVTVLKSGVVDGMAYSLYSDGSIEAQMPEGMMRFASIDELRAHLDQRP